MARFVYYNNNPSGDTEPDCVIRAISLASNLPYEEIEEKLWMTAELLGCERLCSYCYRNLLENVFQFREVNAGDMTIREFADTHPYGTYIIRVPSHLTCIIDGTCYDIWNCLEEICDIVWQVE